MDGGADAASTRDGNVEPGNDAASDAASDGGTDAASVGGDGGTDAASTGDDGGTDAGLSPYGVGEWTWMGGSDMFDDASVAGMQGTPATTNAPGARQSAAFATDANGTLWMFGGFGYNADESTYALSDLWTYSGGEWTWVAGPLERNQPDSYGMLGMPSSTNVPGARFAAAAWIDASGAFWIYGGAAGTTTGSTESSIGYNDLWRFAAGQWTWMDGGSTRSSQFTGTYPGARYAAAAWKDGATTCGSSGVTGSIRAIGKVR